MPDSMPTVPVLAVEKLEKIVTKVLWNAVPIVEALRAELETSEPRIVLFADLSDSTELARKDPQDAFLRTLAHHFTHGVASRGLLEKEDDAEVTLGVDVRIIKTVGDEVIITYAVGSRGTPVSADTSSDLKRQALGGLLRRVIEAALDARDALSRVRVVTKVGLHVCSRYVVPARVLEVASKNGWVEVPDAASPESYFPPDDLLGHDMNLAARVAHSANAGDVILSETAFRLLTEAGGQKHISGNGEKLVFSGPLKFQDWKGIVRVPDLDEENPEIDEMRTARLVGRSAATGAEPTYRWPFHALALLARSDGSPGLPQILRKKELASNLVCCYSIDEQRTLLIPERNGSIPEDRDDAIRFVEEHWLHERSEGEKRSYLGVVRACASSFEVYNDVMRHFIYQRRRSTALTYSSPIMTGWQPSQGFRGAQVKVADWQRAAQPAGIEWGKARPIGEKVCVLLVRAKSFDSSESVLADLIDNCPNLQEAGLLYGEWDVYGILRGATAYDEAVLAIASIFGLLRWDSQLECGLLLLGHELIASSQ